MYKAYIRRGFFFLIFFPLLSINGTAQTNFVGGEVVTTEGDTLKGSIDFQDWSDNPREIEFVLLGEDSIRTYNVFSLKEFSTSSVKYISRFVTIDTTPLKVPDVREVLPTSGEDRVFLKVLAEGELSLYQYSDFRDNFYIEENGLITELISHEYVALVRGRYLFVDSESEKYIDQLNNISTSCDGVSRRRVDYKAASLTWFVRNCNQYLETGTVSAFDNMGTVKLKVSPYIGYAYASTDYHESYGFFGAEEKENIRTSAIAFGVKFLFVLPSDLQKRAITLTLDYQKHDTGNNDIFDDFATTSVRIGYQSLTTAEKSSPYVEGGLFLSARSSEYYREFFTQESFLVGFNLGLGAKLDWFRLGVNFDFAHKRAAEVRYTNLSVVGGFSF